MIIEFISMTIIFILFLDLNYHQIYKCVFKSLKGTSLARRCSVAKQRSRIYKI